MVSLDALIGSLKTHEIKLNEASEESNRKGKPIALKSTQRKVISSKAMKDVEESESEEKEEEEESFDDDEEKDEIAHLGERISKAWIKRKKKKVLSLKRTKRGRQSSVKSSALNAKNLDMLDQNIQG